MRQEQPLIWIKERRNHLHPGRRKFFCLSIRRFDTKALSDGWVDYAIPLKKFKRPDLSEVVIIGFWHPQDAGGDYVAGNVLIDNSRFK